MSNNLRILTTNDFEVVRGDSLTMEFTIEEFDPTAFNMVFGIKDPFTDKIILMALGSTYSKKRNDSVVGGEGIFYFGDTNIPSAVVLPTINDITIKLDQADTLLLEAGHTYNYDVSISNADNSIVRTFIRGALNVQRQQAGNA